jgi:hypothetical protein
MRPRPKETCARQDPAPAADQHYLSLTHESVRTSAKNTGPAAIRVPALAMIHPNTGQTTGPDTATADSEVKGEHSPSADKEPRRPQRTIIRIDVLAVAQWPWSPLYTASQTALRGTRKVPLNRPAELVLSCCWNMCDLVLYLYSMTIVASGSHLLLSGSRRLHPVDPAVS